METFKLSTYLQVTRRKYVHHLVDASGGVESWHQRIDEALKVACIHGCSILVVETAEERYILRVMGRQALDKTPLEQAIAAALKQGD